MGARFTKYFLHIFFIPSASDTTFPASFFIQHTLMTSLPSIAICLAILKQFFLPDSLWRSAVNSYNLYSWSVITTVYTSFLVTSKVCLSSADLDFRQALWHTFRLATTFSTSLFHHQVSLCRGGPFVIPHTSLEPLSQASFISNHFFWMSSALVIWTIHMVNKLKLSHHYETADTS